MAAPDFKIDEAKGEGKIVVIVPLAKDAEGEFLPQKQQAIYMCKEALNILNKSNQRLQATGNIAAQDAADAAEITAKQAEIAERKAAAPTISKV